MQGQQPVLRQTDQSPILQQPGIVIKMNENIQPITTVGMYHHSLHTSEIIQQGHIVGINRSEIRTQFP